MQRSRTWSAAGFCALALTGTSCAQNWLTNGGFDGGLNGWSASPGNVYYDSVNGRSNPGAVTVEVYLPSASVDAHQCVDMTPQNVDLVLYSKVTATGGGSNIGQGSVSFYPLPGCAGSYISNSATSRVQTISADGWKRQTLLNLAVPAGTQSAMAFVSNAVSGSGATSATVIFDDVGFGPAGTFYAPPVSSNLLFNPDFEFDLSGGWVRNKVGLGAAAAWDNTSNYGGVGGALYLQVTSPGEEASLQQCVNLTTQAVDLQLWSKVTNSGGGANTGVASVTAYDQANCAGGYLEGKEASIVATDSSSGWRRFLLSNYALPATTQSALVYFSVGVQEPFDTSISLVADHFGFGPANTFADLLFKNGFE